LDVKYIYKYRSRVSTQLGQSFINALNVVSVYLLKLWKEFYRPNKFKRPFNFEK